MMLIGVDYHPSFQTIAFFVEETGECGEQELKHSDGEAERFYRDLQKRGIRVRVGMEATGFSRWFERLLAELGFQVWMGDPAEIKAKRVRCCIDRLNRQRKLDKWVPGPICSAKAAFRRRLSGMLLQAGQRCRMNNLKCEVFLSGHLRSTVHDMARVP